MKQQTRLRAYQPAQTPLQLQREEWLWSGEANGWFFLSREKAELVWHECAPRILAAWVQKHPGSRPANWWKYDSVEPRRRLGGTGTPNRPVLALGVPVWWYRTSGWFASDAELFDKHDPPRFESQAAYLHRLGLLLPGETERLHKSDFEPEAAE